MKGRLAALAALMVLFDLVGCSSSPTTPPPPPPPPQRPVISLTVTPATVSSGGQVDISFVVAFAVRDELTFRLGVGPLNTDIIVMVSPSGQWGSWEWLTWSAGGVAFSSRRFPTVTTTYTLTASDPRGSVESSRTVTVN